MTLSTETKVGIFFILGLLVLGVMTFKAENMGALFQPKAAMYVLFPHAAGLNVGESVAVAGVKVGEIKAIELRQNGVWMTLSIDANVRIRKDAKASIAWGGLLGNRYIDISLGSPSEPFLPPNSEIGTGHSIEITEVLQKLDEATSKLLKLIESGDLLDNLAKITDDIVEQRGTVGKLLGSDEMYNQAMAIAKDLRKASEDISAQRGTLGKLIGSDEIYNKTLGLADDLKKVSGQLAKLVGDNDHRIRSILENLDATVPEMKQAFASIKRVGEQLDTGKGILPALLKDEKMYQELKDALARLSAAMDHVEEAARSMKEGKGLLARLTSDEKLANDFGDAVKSLKAVAQRLESGDNTLARLTRDKDLYEDVKKLIDDARESLRSIKEQIPLGTFASVLLSSF